MAEPWESDMLGDQPPPEPEPEMTIKIHPMRDRMVVRRVEEHTRQMLGVGAGLHLPATAKEEKPAEGDVVAVGTGRILENGEEIPLSVKWGDRVIFGKYSGTDVTIGGEQLVILREDEILAWIEVVPVAPVPQPE